MKKKDLGNMDMNFKRIHVENIDLNESCILFQCYKCGFHPDVITTIYLAENTENSIHFTRRIEPGRIVITNVLNDSKINKDGEVVEENTCGKCGKIGLILPVPKDIIEKMGIHINKESNNKNKLFGKIFRRRKK